MPLRVGHEIDGRFDLPRIVWKTIRYIPTTPRSSRRTASGASLDFLRLSFGDTGTLPVTSTDNTLQLSAITRGAQPRVTDRLVPLATERSNGCEFYLRRVNADSQGAWCAVDPERSVYLPETRHSIAAKQPFNPNLGPVDDWRSHDLRVSIAPAGVTEPTGENRQASRLGCCTRSSSRSSTAFLRVSSSLT